MQEVKLIHVPIFENPRNVSDADRIINDIGKSVVTRSFISQFNYDLLGIEWTLIVDDFLKQPDASIYVHANGDHYFKTQCRIKNLAESLKSATSLYVGSNHICPFKETDWIDDICAGLPESFINLVY